MSNNSANDRQVSTIPFALLTCCTIGLFFLLVSWAAGGQVFFESLYGYNTLGTLVVGIIAGLIGMKMQDGGAPSASVSPV